jgi:hypothetical protein
LPPESGLIAIESLKDAAIKIGETQEAVGQLPRGTGKLGGLIEAVRLMLIMAARLLTIGPILCRNSEEGSLA